MSAKELSCFHNSKRGETANKTLADIWCLVFSHWLMQRKKRRNEFLSNMTLSTLLNILLIQIVISWFLLQNAWIRHFFFNIHFFFLSPKSRQIAALHIVIFCPCYWIRHLIRPHDWHAEKKMQNLNFCSKALVKVRKSRKQIMVSSILPKNKRSRIEDTGEKF